MHRRNYLKLFQRVEQAALIDDVDKEIRKSLTHVALAICDIGNNAAFKVDLNFVAVVYLLARFIALDYRQTDIDGVAVENSCKCRSDNAGNAACLYSDRRMLARRTAAEISLSNDNVTGLYFLYEIYVNIFHAV